MSSRPWQEIYTDGEYLGRNPTWDVEDSPWKARHIAQMLARNRLVPRSVCDVGCGAGEVLRRLSEVMPEGTLFDGYEISPQAYELACRRANDRLRFHLGDPLAEDAFYDLVLCIDVVEHLEDPFSFLRKLRAKGEHKLFHIPLDMSAHMIIRVEPLLRVRARCGHIHYFSKETALELLKDTGYTIIDHTFTASVADLGRSARFRIARYPRKALFALNQDLAVRLLGGYSLMVLAR